MRKDYKCPTCSKVTLLAECSYKEAVRLKRQCKSCAMKKWQNKKYGNKKTTEFTSTCPNCGVEKKHKWKNISPTQAKTLTETMSKKLCSNAPVLLPISRIKQFEDKLYAVAISFANFFQCSLPVSVTVES